MKFARRELASRIYDAQVFLHNSDQPAMQAIQNVISEGAHRKEPCKISCKAGEPLFQYLAPEVYPTALL